MIKKHAGVVLIWQDWLLFGETFFSLDNQHLWFIFAINMRSELEANHRATLFLSFNNIFRETEWKGKPVSHAQEWNCWHPIAGFKNLDFFEFIFHLSFFPFLALEAWPLLVDDMLLFCVEPLKINLNKALCAFLRYPTHHPGLLLLTSWCAP